MPSIKISMIWVFLERELIGAKPSACDHFGFPLRGRFDPWELESGVTT